MLQETPSSHQCLKNSRVSKSSLTFHWKHADQKTYCPDLQGRMGESNQIACSKQQFVNRSNEDSTPTAAHVRGGTVGLDHSAGMSEMGEHCSSKRFVVTHPQILHGQLCPFQRVNPLETPKRGQESPKEVNEARERLMEGEVKCTAMEIREQPRKAETAAGRKWKRPNKRDRQSGKGRKYCLILRKIIQ